ncbi:MAG: hypothetical protein LAT67_14345 [Balneolales bacterium]|nr:hypothetical protein [Balneolales bacterium]
MTRWYLALFVFSAIILAALIYIDYESANRTAYEITEPSLVNGQHSSFDSTTETYFDFHGEVDMNSVESINNRIANIEKSLSEKEPLSRASIPFYGELILLYQRLGRDDGAGEASRHIAMITHEYQDWWNAALYFANWAEVQNDRDTRQFYLKRAEDAFREAIEASDNPSLFTDFASTLVSLNKREEALSILTEINDRNEGDYRSFLFTGMIFYQDGKKEESIHYIRNSIEKATNEEELRLIRSVVALTTLDI